MPNPQESLSQLGLVFTEAPANPRRVWRVGQLVGEPEVIAHVCWAAIHGLVVLKLADKIAPHISFDQLWREMSRALNVGFGGPQNRLTAAA